MSGLIEVTSLASLALIDLILLFREEARQWRLQQMIDHPSTGATSSTGAGEEEGRIGQHARRQQQREGGLAE